MTIQTIKFSQMTSGGDISNNNKVPGLLAGENVLFNNPWTFLAPGSTAERPIPTPPMYYRLRLNTDNQIYEYYDALLSLWVQLSGSGTGTVNPGAANDLAFYAATGTALSPLAPIADSVLISNASNIPSFSTTLPVGLTIPSATILSSHAALITGSVTSAPSAGIDIANKTYVDGLFNSSVQSITGTTNQVLVSSPTGNVTLSLPQDIATGSTPTFSGLTLSSIPLGIASGGTDTNTFTAYSVICGGTTPLGSLQSVVGLGTAGQQLTSNGPAALPTWQASGAVTPSPLTSANDTNVTITLGGTPATALLQAVSLTMGWTGSLAETRGGTHQTAYVLGDILYASAINTLSRLSGNSTTSPQYLVSTGTGSAANSPSWNTISGSDITGAALTEVNDTNVTMTLGGSSSTALLRAASMTLGWTGQLGLIRGGTAASLTASNGGIVYSTASALAILSGTVTARQMLQSGSSIIPSWSTSTWPATTTINQLLYSSSANIIGEITSAASSVLISDGSKVPSWSTTLPANLTIPTPTISGNATFSANTAGVVGIINSASKAAGVVGEVMSQVVTIAGPVTSSVNTNIATITLTAGNWLVGGELWMSSPGGTTILTALAAGISMASVTMPTVTNIANSRTQLSYTSAVGTQNTISCGPCIINVSGSTQVWLIGNATYSGSAANLNGKIVATRYS